MTDPIIEAVAKAIANADGWATTGSTIADYMPLARAALAAIEQGGWVIVPAEPTYVMRDAFWREMFDTPPDESGQLLIGSGYDAMLAARPKVTE